MSNYIPTVFEDFKIDTGSLLINSFKKYSQCNKKENCECKKRILDLVKETIKEIKKEDFNVDIEPSEYEIRLVLSGILLSKVV